MTRKLLTALIFVTASVLLPAAVASAEVAVPEAAGMMPAVEPAEPADASSVATLLQAAGVVLLLGGGVTLARGWVSPDPAV